MIAPMTRRQRWAVVASLALATWAWAGYRWQVWPQPGFLDHVLRLDGELRGDWYAGLPPPHWAFAHALGMVPPGRLEEVALLAWLAGVLALWTGFAFLAESVGIGALGALGAGLVAVTTGLGGIGVSEGLLGYLYPTALAFALLVCGEIGRAHV
jgi:hypothetical protein